MFTLVLRVNAATAPGTTISNTATVSASNNPVPGNNADTETTAANGRRFGTIIESTGGTPAQIVVERAMYSNSGATVWAAGTNAVATRLQSAAWRVSPYKSQILLPLKGSIQQWELSCSS